MLYFTRLAAIAGAALALAVAPAEAQKVTFTLNWVAGGDHAPYFYAQKLGWYKDAGIDVEFETGRGSAVSAQKVGAGASQMGLSDMAVLQPEHGPPNAIVDVGVRPRCRAVAEDRDRAVIEQGLAEQVVAHVRTLAGTVDREVPQDHAG